MYIDFPCRCVILQDFNLASTLVPETCKACKNCAHPCKIFLHGEADHDETECALGSPKWDLKPNSSSAPGTSRVGVGSHLLKGREPIYYSFNHSDCMYPQLLLEPASSAVVSHIPWCAAEWRSAPGRDKCDVAAHPLKLERREWASSVQKLYHRCRWSLD